jgi:rubrerythrin
MEGGPFGYGLKTKEEIVLFSIINYYETSQDFSVLDYDNVSMEDTQMAEKQEIRVLKSALLLEKQGKTFYEQVASATDNQAVASLFRMMAEEEAKHIEYLSSQFSHYTRNGDFLQQELESNPQSIAQRVLSADIRGQISVAGYEAAAISAAIEMENRAVKIYSDRAVSSKDENEKRLYDWLAQWERGHLKFLSEINDELVQDIWYDNNFWPF